MEPERAILEQAEWAAVKWPPLEWVMAERPFRVLPGAAHLPMAERRFLADSAHLQARRSLAKALHRWVEAMAAPLLAQSLSVKTAARHPKAAAQAQLDATRVGPNQRKASRAHAYPSRQE